MSLDDIVNNVSKEAQGKDLFIFKHKEKFGKEVFETVQKVDVNGLEDEEVTLTKTLQGFFRFLAACGWDPEFVLYKMSEITYQAEEQLFEHKTNSIPLTKTDPSFKMFLQKLGEGDPAFLKGVYDAYLGIQSLN